MLLLGFFSYSRVGYGLYGGIFFGLDCNRYYRCLGPCYTFLFVQPNKIMSEFDLSKRKVFISKTHFILNLNTGEIRFEDIETIEVENMGNNQAYKYHLIVKLKDQPVGKDLGWVRGAEKLPEKLKRFIGLPD